uniref:Uncharacterized protein n=1 Tax=Panagrolaimus sp. ES5 TaxID=591445 RepID=A0AC34F340_9BILA
MQTENHSIDQISQTNMDTITQDEENVVADYKTLQDILNDKIVEIERINKSNADLMEEKENLQLNFLKTNKNLENLVYQKELENKDIFDEKESLNIVIGKLQIKLDTCKKELSTSYMENDRQKQNDDAIKIYSTNKEKELEEEKEALQKVFEAKILELNGMNKLNEELAEEKRLLEHHLLNTKHELVDANKLIDQKESDNKNIIIENISLNDVIGKLQIQCDKFKEELESSVMENDRLKEENDGLMKAVHNYTSNEEKLAEEKQVIQQVLDDKLVEIDDMSKVNEDLVGEKNLLEQELLKAKRELADSNYLVIQKEAEIKNIFDDKQSLDGIINKLQMDYDICKDEFSNALIENDRLKEENEELIKVVNRKTRNEEKLEEEKEVLQQVLDSKTLEMDKLKQLLSNVQTELRFVVSKIRGLYVIKSELEAELDSFKIYFDHVTSSLSNTWANVKTLFDDFAAERLHNVSLSNQLEALQQEITVRERSRTPSLHDEGIMAYDSRRESFNGPALFDGENISQLMSFDERDEMRLDSGIGSNEPTPGTTPRDNIEQQSLVDQCTSSVFSQYLIFTFSLILFYIIYICLYGAIVPSWVYIKLRHERMPPQ